MESGFSRTGKGENIGGGSFLFKKAPHFLQNFSQRNIFSSYEGLFCGVPNLAIDTVVGADFVRNEVNPERPSQSPGRYGTIEMTICVHWALGYMG